MSIYAAAAAGVHEDVFAAVRAMSDSDCMTYMPKPENQAAYEELFEEYVLLHDYFGRGQNRVMERMHARRNRVEE